MQTYRWGIVGLGMMARDFGKALQGTPGAVPHAVCSRTSAKAEQFARIYGFTRHYDSLETFLDDPELDIVYIATPNHLHCDQAIRSLEAGKHVLVEKPYALSERQAVRIREAAIRNNRFCMEAMWSRFLPIYRQVQTLLQSRPLGTIQSLDASFGYARQYDHTRREFDPNLGGGSLLDLGVYPISLALMLLGKPESVTGFCRKTASGVDSMAHVFMRYSNGVTACLQSGFEAELANSLRIGGSHGSLAIHGPIFRPSGYILKHYSPQGATEGGQANGAGLRDRIKQLPVMGRWFEILKTRLLGPVKEGLKTCCVPCQGNGYQYQIIEAMRCLDRGETESAIMPLEESIAVLAITDSLRRDWGISYPEADRED